MGNWKERRVLDQKAALRQSQVESPCNSKGRGARVRRTRSQRAKRQSRVPFSVALRILELRYAALALAISARRVLVPKASRIDISHPFSVTCLLLLHAAACVAVCDWARRADRPHRKPNKNLGRGIQWRSHGPISIACCRRSSLLLFLASLSIPAGGSLRFGFCRVACSAVLFISAFSLFFRTGRTAVSGTGRTAVSAAPFTFRW